MTSDAKQGLACHLYDYLEIACMFHYQVQVKLKSKDMVLGQALDIKTIDGKESLIVKTQQGKQHIPLRQLTLLTVLTTNAKFEKVDFE